MMNAASTSLIFRCLTITEMTHQDDLEYKKHAGDEDRR